eukprot:g1488.t1
MAAIRDAKAETDKRLLEQALRGETDRKVHEARTEAQMQGLRSQILEERMQRAKFEAELMRALMEERTTRKEGEMKASWEKKVINLETQRQLDLMKAELQKTKERAAR